MTPEHLTRLEMSRAADALLDRHRSGEIVLNDRARDLASFLFLPSLDLEVRRMYRRIRDLRREGHGEDDPEIEQLSAAVEERVEAAATELAGLLEASDVKTT